MNTVAVPVIAVASITFYIGVYHLALFARRRDQVDLWFSLTCLVMALYDVASAGLYNSRNLAQGIHWLRLQIAVLSPLGFAFVRFSAAYARVSVPPWVGRALWIFPSAGLFALFERGRWVLTDLPNVRSANTLFGPVMYFEVVPGPAFTVYELAVPVVVCAVLWISRQSKVPRKHRLPLPLAAGLIAAGLLHDAAVVGGNLEGAYVAEYCWFGVVLLMSASLSNEVVDSALTLQTLRETEERIAITLDSIRDAVITTDTDARVSHLNPAAEQLIGTHLSHARGRPLAELVDILPADTTEPVRDPVQYALSRPVDLYGRLSLLSSSTGQKYRVDQAGAPLRHPDGRHVGAVVVYRDLTVQHDALEALQHSQKVQLMGQLAAGVAHDLNNLLTPIISYAELCRRALYPSDPSHTFLGHVLTAGERAAELTGRLLALSRRQILDARVVPVNACVLECEPLFRRLMPEDVHIELSLNADTAHVRLDSAQFQHALMNLVANARDAMPRGGKLTIRTCKESPTSVSLIIQDTGMGMDEHVRGRLFEPFFTTKARGKGTGLGLATVRGIVEQHGGTIDVESAPDTGTTFRICLPLTDEAPQARAEGSHSRDRLDSDIKAAEGRETILVVDDDLAVRRLIEDALNGLGYRVYTTAEAEVAAQLLETLPVELLITDVVMPGVSGPELHATLREHSPHLRCLYMSGHADELLGERGFLAPGTRLLRKPFTVTSLANQVRNVLDGDPVRRTSESPSSLAPSPRSA